MASCCRLALVCLVWSAAISVDAGRLRNRTRALVPAGIGDLSEVERQAISALNVAYQGDASREDYDGYDVDDNETSMQEIENATGRRKDGMYGELLPEGVTKMLRAVGATTGMKYYDLGSGTGKTVTLAWLMGLNAIGVELSETRCGAACAALERLPHDPVVLDGSMPPPKLQFINANLEHVDFMDADIVFINSVLFSKRTMEVVARSARGMRPGTHVVSRNGIPGSGFKDHGKIELQCSWWLAVPYTIQTVENHSFTQFANRGHPSVCQKSR